jgi:phospholipase D1/2
MLGHRDSEVAVVITDEEFETIKMNGQDYGSGKFCGSLRRMLMREHLGIFKSKSDIDITDPICDKFYKDIWIATAAKNSSIYEKVFAVVPTDDVRAFSQLKDYLNKPKLANSDKSEDKVEAKKCLNEIKGHLVLTPLFFLCDEDLTPAWGTQEKLMPQSLWT